MAIRVACPGCLAVFEVSDKFAGRSGACPKCKGKITIPTKDDEIVIHGEEDFGPEDGAGRPVLKPIERSDAKWSPVVAGLIVFGIVLVFVIALMMRGASDDALPTLFILGSLILGPALAFGGYSFLRDDDLEPHRGKILWLRSLICGVGYAGIWGLFAFLRWYLFEGELETFHLVVLVPGMVAIGGGVALVSLDFEYTTGLLHYGLFLLVTSILCWIMGVNPF